MATATLSFGQRKVYAITEGVFNWSFYRACGWRRVLDPGCDVVAGLGRAVAALEQLLFADTVCDIGDVGDGIVLLL